MFCYEVDISLSQLFVGVSKNFTVFRRGRCDLSQQFSPIFFFRVFFAKKRDFDATWGMTGKPLGGPRGALFQRPGGLPCSGGLENVDFRHFFFFCVCFL